MSSPGSPAFPLVCQHLRRDLRDLGVATEQGRIQTGGFVFHHLLGQCGWIGTCRLYRIPMSEKWKGSLLRLAVAFDDLPLGNVTQNVSSR